MKDYWNGVYEVTQKKDVVGIKRLGNEIENRKFDTKGEAIDYFDQTIERCRKFKRDGKEE